MQIPVRVTPARGHGGDHLAGLGVLGRGDAGERGANHRVVELLLPDGDLAFRHGHVGLLPIEACHQGSDLGLGPVEVGGADDAIGGQLTEAAQFALGLILAGPGFTEGFAGGLELGLGQAEAGLDVGRIEPGKDLACFDAHAFLDQDLDDLAGDFGRHCGLPAGGHVAGSIQQGPLPAGHRFLDDHGPDHRRPGPAQEPGGPGTDCPEQQEDGQPPTEEAPSGRGLAVDPEFIQGLPVGAHREWNRLRLRIR